MNKSRNHADNSPLTAPVGFFDSGVGGLSVLQAARRMLPCENTIYFADSAHCPYGSKSGDFVRSRALAITGFLQARGVKAVVVACNSASEAALELLRLTYPGLEIIGVEPALKVAQSMSRNKKIGVLGTPLTLRGGRFSRLLENFSAGMEVYTQPVAGLVERIEAGCADDKQTVAILKKNLQPLLKKGIDTLVLGCTHYPLLKDHIAVLCGPQVDLIDTAEPVARQLRRRLVSSGRLNPGPGSGSSGYFSSGHLPDVTPVVRGIMGDPTLTVSPSPI